MTLDLFAPYQRHSATSLEAARDIAGKAGTLRRLVYEYLCRRGEHGATDEQIQRDLGLDGSTERPRRVRLVELGLVEAAPHTRATRSGRQATVWVAKEAA